MKKWLIRSSTGNASAQLVETSAGIRIRVPGKGSVFIEMSETCAAELRSLPGVSVQLVARVGGLETAHLVSPLSAVLSGLAAQPSPEPSSKPADDPPAPEPPKRKRKRAPRKPRKK